jgi:hypothetical protein
MSHFPRSPLGSPWATLTHPLARGGHRRSAFSTTFRCCEPRCKSDEDCADPYCAGHSQIVYAAGCDSSKDLCETEDAHVFAYRNRHYYVMLEGTTHADAQAQCASSGRALAR